MVYRPAWIGVKVEVEILSLKAWIVVVHIVVSAFLALLKYEVLNPIQVGFIQNRSLTAPNMNHLSFRPLHHKGNKQQRCQKNHYHKLAHLKISFSSEEPRVP